MFGTGLRLGQSLIRVCIASRPASEAAVCKSTMVYTVVSVYLLGRCSAWRLGGTEYVWPHRDAAGSKPLWAMVITGKGGECRLMREDKVLTATKFAGKRHREASRDGGEPRDVPLADEWPTGRCFAYLHRNLTPAPTTAQAGTTRHCTRLRRSVRGLSPACAPAPPIWSWHGGRFAVVDLLLVSRRSSTTARREDEAKRACACDDDYIVLLFYSCVRAVIFLKRPVRSKLSKVSSVIKFP